MDNELLLSLYNDTAEQIRNSQQWQSFLNTAAFNYKRSFQEQILLFAQKPGAAAVLSEKQWKAKYGRNVQKDKAIYLFAFQDGMDKVISVYDITDTTSGNESNTVPIFYFGETQEHMAASVAALNNRYEINESGLESAIFTAVDIMTEEQLEIILPELLEIIKGTPASNFKSSLLRQKLIRLIANSAAYMCHLRCNMPVANSFSYANFRDIALFSPQAIITIGSAMSRVSFEIMQTIIRANMQVDRKIYKNSNRTFEKNTSTLYNQDVNETTPITEREADENDTRLFRQTETELHQGIQTDSLQRSDGTLQNGGTSAGNPNTGKQPVGKFNQAESDFMGNHRGAESSRSGEMDWLNDQSAGNNANAGSRNDSSQLNKEKTTKTAGLAKTLPLFLSLEQVDEVLRQGSLFSQGKYRIFEQFQKESSVQKNADFLKDEYGIGGRYVANALSINYDNKGLEIIEPDSDNKYLLSWNIVAKEIARLINENSYLSTDEAVDYTKYLQERKEREIRSNIADDYCNLVRLYNDQTEEKLNQYALTIGCANEFTAGNDTTNLLNNAGDNIYTLIYASLDTIEQNRLFAEKAKSLKKAFEPYRTDITEAIQKKIQYKYTAGDIAFIGTKRYEIVSVDTNVTLSDISFPLLQETYSVEDFEMELRKNPLNAYLQVSVEKPKLTPEEVAELLPIDGNEILQKYENYFSDDKFFIEADGTLTWIYFNPDSADGGQFVATTISANDVLTANNGAHGYKEFFENLAENKKMILIDVTSSDFRDCAKSFLLDKADIVGYSAEAVEQLVEFAKSNSKKHLPKIEDKITACITYSEHPLFVDETGNKRYRDLSFPLMNKLLGTLNAKHHHERELVPEYDIDWYYKMGFSVDAVINGEKFTYSGRMDIGDDELDVIGLIEEECKNTLKSDYLQEIRKTDEERYQCMHKDLINIRELLVPFMKSHSSLTAADEEKFGEIMEIENSRFSLSEPAKEKISSSATYPTETKKDVILENYRKIKKENPFHIVFYQVGDFYEVIGDDAKTIADALNLVLTSRDVDDSQHIPMCGIPAHRLEEYLKKLQPLDYRVVVSSVENGNRKDFYLIPENTSEPTTENSEIQRAIRLINKYKKEEFGYEDGEDYKDLTSIGLAYTTTEDDQHEIQAEVDLVNFTMRQLVDNNVVMTVQYDSLNELIKNELEVISFDDLVFLEDEAYQKVYGVDRDADDFEHALIGQEIELEGSTFVIESISKDNVFMRDTDFRKHTEYPVSRVEKLDFIRTVFEETPSSAANYHITDNNIGAGKPRERFRNNMNAIKTLHHIENENRTATQEEQDILSQYVGWGGLQEAFDENNGSWSEEFKELKAELSQEEYNAARSSTLTAFYTPPTVIRGIYKALGNMGFKTGNILDPACGIGHFFGMLPETMRQSQLYGTEIDSVSGKIAQQLYPNASIKVQGFENSTTPDNFFDVVVGNVPFGPFKVYDPKYNKYKFLIHDYFFAKAIDQTRPGGVIAFITSNGAGGGTMDKRDNRVRKHIAERCEFLGAIRLPDNTFSKSAGTEISTDIIFLQKRERAICIENNPPEWVDVDLIRDEVSTDSNGNEHRNILTKNRYYQMHPEMVLGKQEIISGPFGPQLVCKAFDNADLSVLLNQAVQNIHATYDSRETAMLEDTEYVKSIPADPNVRNYSYTALDGDIYFRENSQMYLQDVPKGKKGRLEGMMTIRDCVRQVLDYQTEDYPDADIKAAQKNLNHLYDSFVKQYGYLTSRTNRSVFQEDCSAPLLFALEKLDDEGKVVGKADIFSKRTIRAQAKITSVDTATDALAVSISERAKVDMEFMQQLTGKDENTLTAELKGIVFLNPEYVDANGKEKKYLNADEYLSGNVRKKLAKAKEAAEKEPELFTVNVKALQDVQPKDLTPAEIDVKLSSPWLPEDIINQFMYELLDTPIHAQGKVKAIYISPLGEWKISNRFYDSDNVKAYSTYGTKRATAYRIIEDTLNLRDTRIHRTIINDEGKEESVLDVQETAIAQGKQDAIKNAFQNWIWKDIDRRHRLCPIYNDLFNSVRPREYSGEHIRYHGMNPEITMRDHQNDAVAHMLYGNNVLLAHVVGAGKTFEMVAGAMEAKHLGLCQKSIFVVPNHLTEQWASDFLLLYPNANLLVTHKRDFQKENRKRFCSKIATGEYDAIIIGQSQFEKIPMSAERQEAMIRRQIDELIEGIASANSQSDEHFSVKEMERSKRKLEDRLKGLLDRNRKDDVITFEELGVDKMFIDEAHYYKNLFLVTKMRNVAGISQSDAKKSSDLFMKCQYLDEITDEHGVVFATGTPISNSMTELYTMQRYLQYSRLKEMGTERFDEWAAQYGEPVTAMELAPEGVGYRFKTRFSKFVNLPELMSVFKEIADIKTADMLKLPVPKANYHNVVIKPSVFQKRYIESLADRAEAVHKRRVEPYEDNMLRITNEGRKLALDARLLDDTVISEVENKVSSCANNVFKIWEEHSNTAAAQLIFCDLSTPTKDGKFNVYNALKETLIEKGIPENEIAFIHNAKSEVQKKNLFAKVREGKVRVLIGSTQKMGAGTNVQDRLIALHHLDCPWRPSDLEQREGRIIRQGNNNASVEIYRYVTEATFDSYMWQLVESKQKFIAQVMTSKSPMRSAEDIDEAALSYGEVKALASGNPLILEKCQLNAEVGKLNLQKANFLNDKYALEDKIAKQYPLEIAKTKERITKLTADIQCAENHPVQGEGFGSIEIDGTIYDERTPAGEKLLDICKELCPGESRVIGSYRGFQLKLIYQEKAFYVDVKNKLVHMVKLGADPRGNITRIENEVSGLKRALKLEVHELSDLKNKLASAQEAVKVEFSHEQELNQKSEKLAKLNALLSSNDKSKSMDTSARSR